MILSNSFRFFGGRAQQQGGARQRGGWLLVVVVDAGLAVCFRPGWLRFLAQKRASDWVHVHREKGTELSGSAAPHHSPEAEKR